MSRLVVKNLPPKINEDKLLQTFSSKGLVTDVQLKYTKDGKFRQFGFVGFHSENDAKEAQKFFDKTFIGASKISVEICADLGDSNKPRSWSKYAPDSSSGQKATKSTEKEKNDDAKPEQKLSEKSKQKKVDTLLAKYKDDEKFQEFLRVHKRNALDGWNNDAILQVEKEFDEQKKGEDEKESDVSNEDDDSSEVAKDKVAMKKSVSDLDYLKSIKATEKDTKKKQPKEPKNVTYYCIKLSNLPFKSKKRDVKMFLKPLKAKSIRVPTKIHGIAYAGFATEDERKIALKKSKSFLKDKQVIVSVFDKIDNTEREKRWQQQKEGLKTEETVAESGRIFIRNLSYTVSEEDLENLFKPFGPLAEVNLPIDKITRKQKGFAFITFVMPENAVSAFSKLDGSTFQGRLLHLLPGKAKDDDEKDETVNDGSSFKTAKANKVKSTAGSSHNWNTLFLGQSVVADILANKLGKTKQDVLSADGDQSAAVRLALGETQLVAETRSFLEDQGVHLDAFSKPPSSRSKTIILVKNLPAFTKVEEIKNLFAKYGLLGRVILPPSGATAIVEYYEPTEARAAFRKLAYTKFHSSPLYLEWAPEGAFKFGLGAKPEEDVMVKESIQEEKEEIVEEESLGAPEPDTTLFVKNLNFDTTEKTLKDFFSKIGPVYSATIATKKDNKRQGMLLSMGYGFVQFMKSSSVNKALKVLQHKMLDDHCLELKRSTRDSVDDNVQTSRKRGKAQNIEDATCKIVVRNVPFEANEKEIKDLFKSFGILKGVRLPKNFTGSHRGFAFVEFLSKEESKRAFKALCQSTHLYGRRLVLEWAAEEDTIESLRERTANHFVEEGHTSSKKVKKSQILQSLGVPSLDN